MNATEFLTPTGPSWGPRVGMELWPGGGRALPVETQAPSSIPRKT